MAIRYSPSWQRSVAEAAPAAPPTRPPFRRVPLMAGASMPPAADAGAPPSRPTPPVDGRPLPPEPPRRPLELAWLTWQLPARHQEAVKFNLRQTLDWRAQQCQPLEPPTSPPQYTRFGLQGEQLTPAGVGTVYRLLYAELRESVRTLEDCQSRTQRNRLVAMHSVRLGQLCADLEQRGVDTLEPLRCALIPLWDEC